MATYKIKISVRENLSKRDLLRLIRESIDAKLGDVIFDIHNGDDDFDRFENLKREKKILETIEFF